MNNLIYYKINRDVILNTAKDYYDNDQERLREEARDKYRNLSEEEKNKEKNLEKTDIIICLKKRNKNWKNTRKKYIYIERQKSLKYNNEYNGLLIMI